LTEGGDVRLRRGIELDEYGPLENRLTEAELFTAYRSVRRG